MNLCRVKTMEGMRMLAEGGRGRPRAAAVVLGGRSGTGAPKSLLEKCAGLGRAHSGVGIRPMIRPNDSNADTSTLRC